MSRASLGSLVAALVAAVACAGDADAACANLTYHGGAVVSSAHVVVVFWTSAVDAKTQTFLPSFFQTIADSSYVYWLSEYKTPTSPTIGPGKLDATVTITPLGGEGTTVDDAQIGPELLAQIAAGKLPAPVVDASGNVQTIYVIAFPPGDVVTLQGASTCTTFCAYNASTKSGSAVVPYVVLPDYSASSCPAGCGNAATFLDSLGIVASGELAAAITNPGNGPSAASLGWYSNTCGEIDGFCSYQSATVAGYTVGTVWSNARGSCYAGPDGGAPACVGALDGGCRSCSAADDGTACAGATPVCDRDASSPTFETCAAAPPDAGGDVDAGASSSSSSSSSGGSGTIAPPDAGPGAGEDGGSGGGCGCGVVDDRVASASAAAAVLAIAALASRRRRRR